MGSFRLLDAYFITFDTPDLHNTHPYHFNLANSAHQIILHTPLPLRSCEFYTPDLHYTHSYHFDLANSTHQITLHTLIPLRSCEFYTPDLHYTHSYHFDLVNSTHQITLHTPIPLRSCEFYTPDLHYTHPYHFDIAKQLYTWRELNISVITKFSKSKSIHSIDKLTHYRMESNTEMSASVVPFFHT